MNRPKRGAATTSTIDKSAKSAKTKKPYTKPTKSEGKKGQAGKADNSLGVKTTSPDGPYWPLSKSKRISITEFKNKKFVSIREFYSDKESGEMKPGKKGIMLNLDDWKILCSAFKEVNDSLKEEEKSEEEDEEEEEETKEEEEEEDDD